MIIEVVAGVIYKDDKFLIAQRNLKKAQGGLWEFPGGKIEEGETNHQTLSRELREELDINVEIGDFFYQVEHDYPDFHLSMAVFECNLISKEMKMNVHKGIKWLKPEEMMTLDWAAADIPVAEKVFKTM